MADVMPHLVATGTTAPLVPTGLTAMIKSDRRLILTWDASDGAGDYGINEMLVDPDETLKDWVTDTTSTRGPLRGGNYRYGVTARNGAGVSALSSMVDVHVSASGGGTVTPATGGSPAHARGSGDRNTPGGLLDLSRWYLTLPIADPSGDDDSGPWDVYQPSLRTFNSPKYFHVVGDSVEYVAPAIGVTTSAAAGAARCELREMKGPGRDNKAGWGFGDGKTHSLTCTLTCNPTSVDGRKECIVGQIHDETTKPPIYLAVNMNSVPGKLSLFKNGHGTDLLPDLEPSDVFTYRIQVKGGRCRVWAALGDISHLPADPKFDFPASDFHAQSSGCYFKAGAYNKEKISSGARGQSVVRHFRLDLV
jgi:hypothetical protein